MIVLVGITAVVYNIPGIATAELILIPIEFGITWAAGLRLCARDRSRPRRRRLGAARAEREREAAARIAVAEERARIARELHDIVAHAVSVMVLQVGAVRHKLPEAQADDREALRGVERAGRTALTEMRRLLAAMRRDGEEVEFTPQPGLDGLDDRCSRRSAARASRRAARRRRAGPAPARRGSLRVPNRAGGADQRLKHAHASTADVTVRYRPEELQIEVRDDGLGSATTDGLGHGLVGVRRARQDLRRRDGRGHGDGGGFVLSTRLPLDEDER